MNILVIGNGFDLAHGLPTKYGDFLEFVKVIRQVIKVHDQQSLDSIEWGNINIQIRKLIENNMGNIRNNLLSQEQIWNGLFDNNFWIDYFLQCNMYQKENWIDFESEISRVIQSIDNDMKQKGFDENIVISELSVPFLSERFLNDFDLLEQERNMCASKEIRKMEEEGARWNLGKTSDI